MQGLDNERRDSTEESAELSDEDFGGTIAIGALFGIPVTFMVVFSVVLLGTGWTGVAPAILWAALVGGSYFGGFLALALARLEFERRNHIPSSAAQTSILG